jgi:hypothetical protein
MTEATQIFPTPDAQISPVLAGASPTPALIIPLAASRPVIHAIDFPGSIVSGGVYGLGSVRFTDPDGDIYSTQITLVEGGCMEFEYFAFNPMDSLQSGDRFGGTFQFRQSCTKCPDSGGDQIRMRVQLYDRGGHESEPADYVFHCR